MPRPLDEYERKRDFSRTPEPPPDPGSSPGGEPAFVLHRHDASSLHYDLRLEMAGVLVSWAVPKGLSWVPKEKRLAVRTEDHPLEYLSFSGVIPRGEYGAGTMTILDRGRWSSTRDDDGGLKGLEEGKLEFFLRGRRFRGEWHLVRTKRGQGNEWLLFKASDGFDRGRDDDPPGDLTAAIEAPMPEALVPMEASGTREPFSDPDWLFEAAFRGRRVLAFKRGDAVTLRSIGETLHLEDVAGALRRIRAERAVLDGVLVALDTTGRPSEDRLAELLNGAREIPHQLYVSDLPHWEEFDLAGVPLVERKTRLAFILRNSPLIPFADHIPAKGEELAATVAAMGLDGVVAKRRDSHYVSGASKDWIRIPVSPDEKARSRDVAAAFGERPGAPRVPGVRFTNLDKVLWPEDGYTKGDLIRYYDLVSEHLLPHLKGRPVHLRRMPDGIEGEAFYQRHPPAHLPEWVEMAEIPDSEGRPRKYIVCNERRTLLYLVNLASIDLHPWMSRLQTPAFPDYAVIDLDPKEAPFENVVKVARAVGKVLDAIGVKAWVKTSGKTGIHIHIPLPEGYTHDHGRMFCEAVCRVVAKEHPSLATVERIPGKRGGRVYLDFMQNHRGQTVVPPYVVRPVPRARVSTPLAWDELGGDLDPDRFTIATVPERLARAGDLYRGVLSPGPDLMPAIEALGAYLAS